MDGVELMLPGTNIYPSDMAPNSSRNPYVSRGALSDKNIFVGRTEELKRLMGNLAKKQSVSIYGERGIGKTSLLYRFKSLVEQEFPKKLIAYLDFQAVPSENDFYLRLAKILEIPVIETPVFKVPTFIVFEKALAKKPLVLLIDEFDRAMRQTGDFSDIFFDSLRSWGGQGLIQMFVVTHQPIRTYASKTKNSSPFENIFVLMELKKLEDSAASVLLEQLAPYTSHWDPGWKRIVIQRIGSLPANLQLFGAEAFNRLEINPKISLDEIIDAYENLGSIGVNNFSSKSAKKSRTGLMPDPSESIGYLEKNRNPRTDSDRPSGQDQLNYETYAQAFAKIILNHETSTPLTIGIYGQWGQGKSFLMGKIRDALNDQRKKREEARKRSSFWKPFRWWLILVTFEQLIKSDAFERFIAFCQKILELFTNALSGLVLIVVHPKIIIKRYKFWREERKKEQSQIVDYHVVEFNAWSYVGTDHLWAGLVTQLYREADQYFGIRATVARLWQALSKSLPKSIPIFLFYGLLGLGISLLTDSKGVQTGWNNLDIAVNTFLASVLGGSALASLPILWKTLTEFADNLFLTRSKNLQNLAAKPDFSAQIGIMAEIKKEIRFIARLLKKGKQGHPTRFVLFIDDLDRCEHHKAVEVLQAIMLLLTDEDSAPFVIFLGIDARVLVSAIEETYGKVLVKAGINGYEYLDKIVQIPFTIPGASEADIKKYVDSMLWSSEDEKKLIEKKTILARESQVTPTPNVDQNPISNGIASVPSVPVITPQESSEKPLEEIEVTFNHIEREAIEKCTNDLIDNPRKIKRIINIYRFARLLLPSSIDRAIAIRWYLMVEQWPVHVAWIIEFIENDAEQAKKRSSGKSVLRVFNQAKQMIHSPAMASLLSIDADPDRFKKFVESKPLMTVQEIKTLLPYTFNLNPAIRSEVCKHAIRLAEVRPLPRKKPVRAKPGIGTKESSTENLKASPPA